MSMSDPIADMLTRVRNALLRNHKSLEIPSSKTKVAIAKVLKEEGFITDYSVEAAKLGQTLNVTLKYDTKGESIVRKIDRVSKPGLRVYKGSKELKPYLGGQGIFIVSTHRGVISDQECRKQNVGGEVLCSVY